MKIDEIVSRDNAYRTELCNQVRGDSGIERVMLEKDLWVTYVLERIFAHPVLSQILRFKGGTSLSNPTFHVRIKNPSVCWGSGWRSSLHFRFSRFGEVA